MSRFLKYISEVTVAAGELLLSQTVKVNSHKSRNDLLTENDLLIENFIIGEIRKYTPDVNIVSEEYNPDNSLEGLTVVIDPIDGTCNFAVGMSLFGIQIAVFCDCVCEGAIIYFPESKEMLTAEKGKGAYLNGNRLSVAPNASAADGMLLISDYYEGMRFPFDKQFALVKELQKHFLKTRHFGAACVDFSLLAKSNALGYITYYHKLWDIAPGLLIACEAGCVYASLDAPDYEYGNPGLIVANNSANLKIISQAYSKL